jgi:dolichol-phosphate mannosyltransferase
MSSNKVCVVIPTYNEADNIEPLVHGLEALGCIDWIVIIDDSSNDGTFEKLAQLKTTYDNLIVHIRLGKLGFGTALKDGFQIALEKLPFTRLVQMDADFSHDPSFIPRLLLKQDDIVIGSRYIDEGKIVGWSRRRTIISKTANFLVNSLLKVKVHDVTSGLRAYSRRAVETIAAETTSTGYEFEVESILLIQKQGLTVCEVPITFIDRKRGGSKLKLLHITRFFFFILKNINV